MNIVLPTVVRLLRGLRTSPRPKKAAKSKWRRASRLAKLNAYVDNEDAFVKEGLKHLAEAGDVVTEVTEAEEVPLWQQGDISMYGTFTLGTRSKLRTNPLIIAAIDLWWEVVLASLHAQGQLGAEVTATDRLQATVDKAEYVRIGRCLFKALMPVWDEAEAQLSAEDDWEQDAKGKPAIDRRSFGESMFQLVDLWTTGTDPAEYALFLDGLLEQATHAPPHRSTAAPLHRCIAAPLHRRIAAPAALHLCTAAAPSR